MTKPTATPNQPTTATHGRLTLTAHHYTNGVRAITVTELGGTIAALCTAHTTRESAVDRYRLVANLAATGIWAADLTEVLACGSRAELDETLDALTATAAASPTPQATARTAALQRTRELLETEHDRAELELLAARIADDLHARTTPPLARTWADLRELHRAGMAA